MSWSNKIPWDDEEYYNSLSRQTLAQTSQIHEERPIENATEEFQPTLAETFEPSSFGNANLGLSFRDAGAIVSSTVSKFTADENQASLAKASLGQGREGSAYTAMADQQIQNAHNSDFRQLESSALMVGGSFGPEGLAIGAGVAGALEIANMFTNPPPTQVMGTNGQMTTPTP